MVKDDEYWAIDKNKNPIYSSGIKVDSEYRYYLRAGGFKTYDYINDQRITGYTSLSGTVIEPRFDYLSEFSVGIAMFSENGKAGFIRMDGTIICEAIFDFDEEGPRWSSWDGRAIYRFSEGISGFRKAPDIDFDQTEDSVDSKTLYYTSKYGFIDKTGKEIIPPIYDFVGHFYDGLALIVMRDNMLYGYINKEGVEVVPMQFSSAHHFSEGFAAVANYMEVEDPESGNVTYEKKWGIIYVQ